MNKKIKAGILLSLAVVSLSHHNADAKNNGFVEGCLAVGAAAIGIAGIATAVNYCFSESDDQLIARAESEHIRAANAYSGMFYDFYCDPYHTGLEFQLYEIASIVWNKGQSQNAYRSGMRSARDQLQSSLEKLRKRFSKLISKRNYEDQSRARRMNALIGKIESFLLELNSLYNFIEKHRYYFDLYESDGKISNYYSNLIAIARSGSYYAAQDIKQAILYADNGRYPYINFVKTIKSNIATLKTDMRYLAYSYPNRAMLAQNLIDTLSWMRNIVVADVRYSNEQYDQEQERLEQERQRLAREQLEMYRAQLRAQEAQLRAQQELARANRAYGDQILFNMCCEPTTTADLTINLQFGR
jgi:hypothetical protein